MFMKKVPARKFNSSYITEAETMGQEEKRRASSV
jgi:hypothetical protein